MTDRLDRFKSIVSRGDPVTIDFVGDSIVWGLNHCTAEETFVAAFAALFSRAYPTYRVTRYDGTVESEALPIARFDGPFPVGGSTEGAEAAIIRNGVGGNTVRRAIRRKADFLGSMPSGRPADLTFLMFGINDALRADPAKYVTPERFERDYRELVEILLSESESAIVTVTPTYNGENYPLISYAEAVKRVAADLDLPCFDAHRLWAEHYRAGAPRFGQGDWLSESATDACHFSPKGARETAAFLFKCFRALLSD